MEKTSVYSFLYVLHQHQPFHIWIHVFMIAAFSLQKDQPKLSSVNL